MSEKKITIVTHNGAFHADDVCAVATLDLLYKGEVTIIRTRDEKVIETGDIVLDVGGKNDGQRFFDHHQEGGAGARLNGIPYASFGLIWKRFGKEIIENKAVEEKFDHLFIQPIDATDNGIPVVDSKFKDVYPLSFNSLVAFFNPFWNEDESERDAYFMQAVQLMKQIIKRVFDALVVEEAAKTLVLRDYENAPDKRVIVLEDHYPYVEVLSKLPEPLFAVYKSPQNQSWHVKAIWNEGEAFKTRKNFPETWGGKMNETLAAITGVPDALFCHNKLFLVTAKTKEAALKLASLAIAA